MSTSPLMCFLFFIQSLYFSCISVTISFDVRAPCWMSMTDYAEIDQSESSL